MEHPPLAKMCRYAHTIKNYQQPLQDFSACFNDASMFEIVCFSTNYF
jgi:hypothetical protein